MKKTHLILLIVTALTILFSAYSLAAFNQIYKINFEWFSQYNNRFTPEQRKSMQNEWHIYEYPEKMKFGISADKFGMNMMKDELRELSPEVSKSDLNKYVLIYASLGELDSPEYRVKIIDIAQRETVVEIKVGINTPPQEKESKEKGINRYFPKDIIRVDRTAFPVRGKLRFIFKNQDGRQFYECYSYIK